jgi:hypothetical protein
MVDGRLTSAEIYFMRQQVPHLLTETVNEVITTTYMEQMSFSEADNHLASQEIPSFLLYPQEPVTRP